MLRKRFNRNVSTMAGEDERLGTIDKRIKEAKLEISRISSRTLESDRRRLVPVEIELIPDYIALSIASYAPYEVLRVLPPAARAFSKYKSFEVPTKISEKVPEHVPGIDLRTLNCKLDTWLDSMTIQLNNVKMIILNNKPGSLSSAWLAVFPQLERLDCGKPFRELDKGTHGMLLSEPSAQLSELHCSWATLVQDRTNVLLPNLQYLKLCFSEQDFKTPVTIYAPDLINLTLQFDIPNIETILHNLKAPNLKHLEIHGAIQHDALLSFVEHLDSCNIAHLTIDTAQSLTELPLTHILMKDHESRFPNLARIALGGGIIMTSDLDYILPRYPTLVDLQCGPIYVNSDQINNLVDYGSSNKNNVGTDVNRITIRTFTGTQFDVLKSIAGRSIVHGPQLRLRNSRHGFRYHTQSIFHRI